jgi:hypothetical protein
MILSSSGLSSKLLLQQIDSSAIFLSHFNPIFQFSPFQWKNECSVFEEIEFVRKMRKGRRNLEI